MKSVGIREAKARLSELARDAAKGEVTMLTFPIAISGSPVIAFMTWCSSRPLRRMVIACSRGGMRCLAHGLTSLWLLLELAEAEKTPPHSSARILGQAKIA
jgi:hypothetical protein